jgi:hypothetical protein
MILGLEMADARLTSGAADVSSDGEGGRPGAVGFNATGGICAEIRRGANCSPVGAEPFGQMRDIGWGKSRSLSGETAEGTLVVAMIGRGKRRGTALFFDTRAQIGGVSEYRLEIGRDRGWIRS